jgi:Clp amino terminal domain, pathogenicity island component
MDDEQLNGNLKEVVFRAIEEARRRGSDSVEAEHLMLALAWNRASVPALLMADVDLDYESLDAALTEERARSLAFVGIANFPADRLVATPKESRPNWGASSREALSRSRRIINERAHARGAGGPRAGGPRARTRARSDDLDLLTAILRAEFGTVPRALAFAGVDREALLEVASGM